MCAIESDAPMAYATTNSRGQTYYLHGKNVLLKNGRMQRIYYFARAVKPVDGLDAMPDGFEISENPRTGLPILRRAQRTGAA